MSYSARGKRVQKQSATQTTKFLYDFGKVLQETDGGGTTTHEYTSTTDQYGDLLSAYDGSSTSYYEHDALGSTDALINDAEAATDRYVYRAFGLDTHYQGTSSSPYTFVGEKGYSRESEIDLYFVRDRYYDYAAGRWISEDPVGYQAGDVNLYRYVFNNPVKDIDPSGNALWLRDDSDLVSRVSRSFKTQFASQCGMSISDLSLTSTYWRTGFGDPTYYKVNLIENINYKAWRTLFVALDSVSPSLGAGPDCQGLANRIQDMYIDKDYTFNFRRPYDQCLGRPPAPTLESMELSASTGALDFLKDLLYQVGEWGDRIRTNALQGLLALGRVALTALLKFFGLSESDVWDFFDYLYQFLQQALAIARAIVTNPSAFFDTLLKGVGAAVDRFIKDLDTNLIGAFVRYILDAAQIVIPPGLSFSNPESVARFLLDFFGITWNSIKYAVIAATGFRINLQGLNRAFQAIDSEQFRMFLNNPTNLESLFRFITSELPDFAFNLEALFTDLKDKLKDILLNTLVTSIPNIIIGFFPGVNFIKQLYSIIRWIFDNFDGLMQALGKLRDAVDQVLAGNQQGVAQRAFEAFELGLPKVIGLVATVLGINIAAKAHDIVAAVDQFVVGKKAAVVRVLRRKILGSIPGGGGDGGPGCQPPDGRQLYGDLETVRISTGEQFQRATTALVYVTPTSP